MPYSASNGRLPDSALQHLNWPEEATERLAPDAAASINLLAVAFHAAFATPLRITDSYRSYAEQVAVHIAKPHGSATPGASNHGLGIALDMASGINSDGTTTHRWMENHAGFYGWSNPWWAQDYNPANGAHEPWHWEYSRPNDRSRDTHDLVVPIQEDDMPLNSADIDAVGERVKAILRAPEFQNGLRDTPWAHPIAGAGLGPAPAEVWLADARLSILDISNVAHGLVAQVAALTDALAAKEVTP
jgi:hypothetical protein